MKSFIIKELVKKGELSKLNWSEEGFHYKLKKHNSLNVKEIIIVNPEIINSLIESNFNKQYKKIVEYYLNILQDDDDTSFGKLMLALDEITRLRNILIKKYNRCLRKKEEEKMLKKLKILENEIRIKIIDFRLIKEEELVHNNIEEKQKSR